jgi:hypothetical protein
MRIVIMLFLLVGSISILHAQKIRTTKDTVFWVSKKTIGLDINQVAFMNWNAGGNSSIAGLLRADFSKKYTRESVLWNNEISVRYGINKQDGRELRKTDDVFSMLSNFGYKKDPTSNCYYSARFSFNTQFSNGYSYPNTDTPISKPFAPAYLFLGVGSEHNLKEKNLNFYFSPLTVKTTLVLDQRLADLGSFGVNKAVYDEAGNLIQKGKMTRNEVGILLSNFWKTPVYKNMTLENRLSLYTDYINKFGNIDVDWQIQLDMVVNDYVRANIGLHMLYDDDVKAKEQINGVQTTVGPKVQLKQGLGIGFVYIFKEKKSSTP